MSDPIINRLPLSQMPPPLESAKRVRELATDDVRDLLRVGSVRFAVAMMLAPFRIVPEAQCYEFWKSEVQPHLVSDPEDGAVLENFSDGYCYYASEWSDGGSPIVLLSAVH